MVNIAWELGLNEDWEGQSRIRAHIWSALIGLGIARWRCSVLEVRDLERGRRVRYDQNTL